MATATDYRLEWKQNYSIHEMPEGQKLGILKNLLAQVVLYNQHDPITRSTAVQILHSYSVPQKDWLNEAVAIWDWVRNEIRFTLDPRGIERFQTARRTLEDKAGDCDDQATLVASLLMSIGHEACLFLLDGNKRYPGQISHAVGAVKLPTPRRIAGKSTTGKWIILETTKKMPFGWKPPWATRWERVDIEPGEMSKDTISDAPPIPNYAEYDIKRRTAA